MSRDATDSSAETFVPPLPKLWRLQRRARFMLITSAVVAGVITLVPLWARASGATDPVILVSLLALFPAWEGRRFFPVALKIQPMAFHMNALEPLRRPVFGPRPFVLALSDVTLVETIPLGSGIAGPEFRVTILDRRGRDVGFYSGELRALGADDGSIRRIRTVVGELAQSVPLEARSKSA